MLDICNCHQETLIFTCKLPFFFSHVMPCHLCCNRILDLTSVKLTYRETILVEGQNCQHEKEECHRGGEEREEKSHSRECFASMVIPFAFLFLSFACLNNL